MTAFHFISILQFPEEGNECVEYSKYQQREAISWRTFSEPDSPFHMFFPAAITLNGVKFESAGQYMLYKLAGK